MNVPRIVALGLAAALALAGCTGTPSAPSPSGTTPDREQACAQAVASIVKAVDDLVSSYEPSALQASASPSPTASSSAASTASGSAVSSPETSGSPSLTASADPLADAVTKAKNEMTSLGCDSATANAELAKGLAAIDPQGAIAKAVWRRVSASMLGKVDKVSQRILAAGEDLADALARAAPGSTLILPAGTREVPETLVLLDGVVIAGAGPDATRLHSTAADAAFIVATDGRIELRDVSLDLSGGPAASGLIAGPAASVVLTRVRVSGAVAGQGAGGAGVQLSAEGTAGSGRGTTLEVTDSVFSHNGWAGLVVSGGHRVSIRGATFEANKDVALLFTDSASGSVSGSTFTDNGVGVAATGQATPSLLSSTIKGGSIGLQFSDKAAPAVDGLKISGSSSAAVVFGGETGGVLAHVVCTGVHYGIVIGDTSAPTLTGNECEVARGS